MSAGRPKLFAVALLCLVSYCRLHAFNLEYAAFEPQPKPAFLINATDDVFSQFMAIYRTNNIHPLRKVTELDILMGTLRPVVQESYQQFKADAILEKIGRVENLLEMTKKAHYTFVHMKALSGVESDIGKNERKQRTEMLFTEFGDHLVKTLRSQIEETLTDTMKSMLKAILITENFISQ
uniref:Fatty-acid and retinol-binding protein 1 n=1 Tax=Steinernema glaseri TaxID=37863 RepID=A0A1I7ZA64_9BILA